MESETEKQHIPSGKMLSATAFIIGAGTGYIAGNVAQFEHLHFPAMKAVLVFTGILLTATGVVISKQKDRFYEKASNAEQKFNPISTSCLEGGKLHGQMLLEKLQGQSVSKSEDLVRAKLAINLENLQKIKRERASAKFVAILLNATGNFLIGFGIGLISSSVYEIDNLTMLDLLYPPSKDLMINP